MDTTQNNGNSNPTAPGVPSAPPEFNINEVHDTLQQVGQSISLYFREHQRSHENLNRLMDQPSDQFSQFERELKDMRRDMDRQRDWIRNNRNY